ncbi:MAG: hypothetical protein A3I79_00235 [Gemmatimonadetes bacterium RIFCSPLOWO2_02_FULL_71_11]|nr:MAG: hypothetical protein A3I79_00235 [Gemmatimonadetes bacterium RIFCSPLOWO2_02_FULL_71_11]
MSRPHCDATGFGWIEIDGERYEHDVLIRLGGKIKKRKKKLSKRIYGTSHTVSSDEAEHVFEKGARTLIIGSGQQDNVRLSPEAEAYFERHHCSVSLLPTPQALRAWNDATADAIGLFHVTC